MLRRNASAAWAAAAAATAGITVASRRTFCKPTPPCALVYTPPGTRRDSAGMSWRSRTFSPQQQQQQQQSQQSSSSPSLAASGVPVPPTTSSPSVSQPPQPASSMDSTVSMEEVLFPSSPAAPRQPPQQQQRKAAQVVKPPPASSARTAEAAAAAAALPRSSSPVSPMGGGLKATPARRMSALTGPSLDTRVDEIVKVEENVSAQLLPQVVQLLIDPEADGVERITLSDFAAMQPRRQLMALGGKKAWLEFLLNSPYYQQVARLATESPAHDLRALQQAGITTLYQWADKPNVVTVSPRTTSALDGAVEQSIRAYMNEVAQVVNTSNQLEPLLNSWVSDVVGKFVLDSLKISVESASAALWVRRGGYTGKAPSGSNDATGTAASAGMSALGAMFDDDASRGATTGGSVGGQGPVLRPGEACTLEHYNYFTQKVLHSVRQDVQQQQQGSSGVRNGGGAGGGDAQSEAEIGARTHTVIATALTQLLDQAVAQHLPAELRPLYNNGYIAMDRMPALLRRAVSFLQLRSVPVQHFVFHSTAEATSATATSAAASAAAAGSASPGVEAAAAMSSKLNIVAPAFGPGTFLTGSTRMDVTLGEWSGRPEPPSSTDAHDPAQLEYLSVLHRIRKHLDKLSMTPLHKVLSNAEAYGANGFEAFAAVGLDQLFGHAKLVEDRLVSLLNYPPATSEKPVHFIEAGYASGKTAILERLAQRTRSGERAAIVRYGGTSTPFIPDLDDHPVAFASRFWFRVALASCPFLIRTEELFSRAPRSVWWWGNHKNWSWESFQSLIASASHTGRSRGGAAGGGGGGGGVAAPAQLTTILVDDFDRVLNALEAKWAFRVSGSGAGMSAAAAALAAGTTALSFETSGGAAGAGASAGSAIGSSAARLMEEELDDEGNDDDEAAEGEGETDEGSSISSTGEAGKTAPRRKRIHAETLARQRSERRMLAAMSEAEARQVGLSMWLSTGKTIPDLVSSAFAKLTVALGQVDFVFTGQRVSPMLLQHAHAPVRRCFIPVSSGVGLPQRLRVLPLLSVLHALHLRAHLEMPGLLYEVLKNSPALAGKTMEIFWSGRVAQLDLRVTASSAPAAGASSTTAVGAQGGARLLFGEGGPLVHAYEPRELYAEMPLRHHLLRHPRRTRLRLVELLQRQLSSPSGYLNSGIDTDAEDARCGLVTPHSHTTSQVHPFALFTIFSHQDALELASSSLSHSPATAASSAVSVAGHGEDEDGAGDGSGDSSNSNNNNSSSSSSGGGGSRRHGLSGAAGALAPRTKEKKVVRAWAEVWSEYRAVVHELATTSSRKRDAMRVLLHGALLLRSAAVAGANLDLNLKVPSYGFPLLSTEVRMKGRHVVQPVVDGAEVRPATTDTVRKAAATYKSFFSNASQSHFPFRPMVGLNGGCDVVCVSGTTLGLYDIITTMQELREVPFRFAEALVGVLHVLERQVMPVDKVKAVQYVSVVFIDQVSTGVASASPRTSSWASSRESVGDVFAAAGGGAVGSGATAGLTAAMIPYLLDLSALFEDDVLDRLKAIQEPLGITKEFRTLSDILDELERRFNVRVHQEIVASQEELEALFSPTLLQLVPDATVLPPYTQAVVSAEDLMMEAMLSGGPGGNQRGPHGTRSGTAMGLMMGDMGLGGGGADDDDEDGFSPGAEVDDINAERMLSTDSATHPRVKQDVLLADSEALHESAELLEAMLNDQLDELTDSSSAQAAQARTARELSNDLMMENSINYGKGVSDRGRGTAAPQPSPQTPPDATGGGRPTTNSTELDSLAWLHDIITPESLRSSAQSVPVVSGAATPAAPASPMGLTPFQQQQQRQQATLSSGLEEEEDEDLPGLVASATDPSAAAAEHHNEADEEESAGWREALAAGGVETTTNVFPRTAAKRKDQKDAAAAAAAGATAKGKGASDPEGNGESDEDADADGHEDEEGAGDTEDEDGETDLASLLDRAGSQTSKARRAAAGKAKKGKKPAAKRASRRKAGSGGRGGGPHGGGRLAAVKEAVGGSAGRRKKPSAAKGRSASAASAAKKSRRR